MITTTINFDCPNCQKQNAKAICLDGDPEKWSIGTIVICEVLDHGEDKGCGATLAINTRVKLDFKATVISTSTEIQEQLL